MKFSKSFLLGSAVALTVLPLTLSADIDPKELEEKIRTARACPASQEIALESAAEQGWFSSFRSYVGKGLRKAGNSLRTEEDQSAAGQVKEAIKDGVLSFVSAKTGIPFQNAKEVIFNSLGNGLRTVGQVIKGGTPKQTVKRVTLDSLELNKWSDDNQIKRALATVAKANLKVNKATAVEDYRLVIEGMVKRGYATSAQMKAIDVNAIYLDALAEETLAENNALTSTAFIEAVKINGFEVLEQINPVKNAPVANKVDVMNAFLKGAYEKLKAQETANIRRNKAIAPAPTARAIAPAA